MTASRRLGLNTAVISFMCGVLGWNYAARAKLATHYIPSMLFAACLRWTCKADALRHRGAGPAIGRRIQALDRFDQHDAAKARREHASNRLPAFSRRCDQRV